MSRPTGTRDKKDLYDRIIKHLKKHKTGMNAYAISQALKVNDSTCRKYLNDLEEQERIIGLPVTKTVKNYILTDNN